MRNKVIQTLHCSPNIRVV